MTKRRIKIKLNLYFCNFFYLFVKFSLIKCYTSSPDYKLIKKFYSITMKFLATMALASTVMALEMNAAAAFADLDWNATNVY